MFLFIGIDFSKEKFDACAICADGVSVKAEEGHESFKNSKRGFHSLLAWAEKLCDKHHVDELLFCGENTGDYCRKAADYIYGKGYDLWLANPLAIKRNNPMQRQKTDKTDAKMIAEYAMRHYDQRKLYESPSKAMSNLRELYLYRNYLVNLRKSVLVRDGEKHYTLDCSKAKSMNSQDSRTLLKVLDKLISKRDDAIMEVIKSDEELRENFVILKSVPGIGMLTAVCLIIYTDNFKQFDYDARRLACYFGVAPFKKESGTSVNGKPHVSHLCNHRLKAALHEAALTASRCNKPLKAYYDRLLANGKPKPLALNNLKSKMLHLVMALVKNKTMFDENYRSPLSA